MAAIRALTFFVDKHEKVRDDLVERGLLVWMEEISSNLKGEVSLQIAIVQFIFQCLKKKNWPLMTKCMPAIRSLFTVFNSVVSLYPFEQSQEPQQWSEKYASRCLFFVLLGFELIYDRNRTLFEMMAIQ